MIRLSLVVLILVFIIAPDVSIGGTGIKEGELVIDRNSISLSQKTKNVATITGKVVSCKYTSYEFVIEEEPYPVWEYWPWMKDELRDYRQYRRKEPPKTREWGHYKHEYREVIRRSNHQMHEFLPKSLKIEVPKGKDVVVNVSSDGKFSGDIELYSGYRFSKGSIHDPAKGMTYVCDKETLEFIANHPKGRFRYGVPWEYEISCYYLQITSEFGKSCVTHIIIDILNKNTRVPVPCDITVTPVSVPSFQEIFEQWKVEYGKSIADKGIQQFWGFIDDIGVENFRGGGGQDGGGHWLKLWPIEKKDSMVSFCTFRGAKYKIETRNPHYYYFVSTLTTDDSPKTKRTILLVETGSKIRPDDEGHAGQMIRE